MMKLLDTNIVIRFLLEDSPKQFLLAKKLLNNNNESLVLTDVTFAEIIWLLTSFYHLSKERVVEKLFGILNLRSIKSNRNVLIRALYFYRNFNIDYIDAYHAAYSEEENLEGVYSFDEDLDKIKSIKRFKL
ncbi:hypothetical protein A2769_03260 [Candidatus Daviesbacteria bacterium RIFCSPHIGHO2_01_FULL_37_27]|nr:MAG: hypothetical protein A2769_03260 [Candidatus Daviesbacteria bacterium RIFCSPHIGHO2_01_FULL_37_27]